MTLDEQLEALRSIRPRCVDDFGPSPEAVDFVEAQVRQHMARCGVDAPSVGFLTDGVLILHWSRPDGFVNLEYTPDCQQVELRALRRPGESYVTVHETGAPDDAGLVAALDAALADHV